MARRSSTVASCIAVALAIASSHAAAEPGVASAPGALEPLPAPATETAAVAPKAARRGIAVVATAGASRDAAFSLARGVYASTLRPPQVDEPSARALAGEVPASDASPRVRELGELRAGLVREDAATRKLLAAIADATSVEALLVVGLDDSPSARLYLAESAELDAARYVPDLPGTFGWQGTLQSLERRFPRPRSTPTAPTAASASIQLAPGAAAVRPETSSRPFYASAWLWGSIGAAALFAGAFFLASRDTADDPIGVRMQIPR